MLQSENGLLGIGPSQREPRSMRISSMPASRRDDAAGLELLLVADSFGMIRRHINLAILGPCRCRDRRPRQLDDPGKMVKGMAGRWTSSPASMRVVVVMEHTAKKEGRHDRTRRSAQVQPAPHRRSGVVNRSHRSGVLEVAIRLKTARAGPGVNKDELAEKTGAAVA